MSQTTKLVITTGHYPKKDVGAVGYAVETTINRELMSNMQKIADNYFKVPKGLIVYWNDNITGSGTVGTNLYNTVKECNKHVNAKLVVNLHLNSFSNENSNGTENYISRYSSKKNELTHVSNNIIKELQKLGYTDRKTKETTTFYFNMNTEAPSMLTESFFVSNKRDVEIYYANKIKIAYIYIAEFMKYVGLGQYVKPFKDTMLIESNVGTPSKNTASNGKEILGYRLFTGTYNDKVTAVNQGKKINFIKGWNVYTEKVNGKYRLKTGLFKTMQDAENGAKFLLDNKITTVYHIITEYPENIKVEKPINANNNVETKLHYIKFNDGLPYDDVKASAENVRKSTKWIVHTLQHKNGKYYNKTGTFKTKKDATLGLQTLNERKLIKEGVVMEN